MTNISICIVTRNDDNFSLLESLLKKLSFKHIVHEATVPQQLFSEDVLIYCDTTVSKVKSLRNNHPHLPILVCQESSDIEDINQFLAADADDYLIKQELTEASLFRAIHTALKHKTLCEKQMNTAALLQKAEERLEYAFSATSDVVYDWDLAKNKMIWGRSISKHLGYSSEQLDNIQKFIEKVHPDDLLKLSQRIENIIKGNYEKGDILTTYQFKKGDDSYIIVSDRATVLKDEKGNVTRVIGAIEDATIRLKAEHRIKASEAKYSLLFYKSPMAKLIYRLSDRKITDVNDAAVKLYGYSRNAFKELNIEQLCARTEYPAYIRKVASKKEHNQELDLGRWTHFKKSGESFDVEIIGYELELNEVPHIMLSCNDVSAKVKAMEKLEEITERYHYVHQAIHDVIWDYDVETKTFSRSENFKKIYGYKTERFSKPFSFWKDHIHPEDKERVVASFKHALKSEDSKWSFEYRFKRKNGKYAHIEDEAIILRSELGRAYRVIGSFRDVTERVEREQELKLLESVITHTNDAILITEAQPVDEPGPRIIYANEGFYKQTGYSAKEIIDKTPRILQGPRTDRKELDRIRTAIERYEPCCVEVINYTKDNKEFYVEISIDPVFDQKGECTHFISIQRDITKRKNQEIEDELFNQIYKLINPANTMKEQLELMISSISEFANFDLSECWLTSLDNTELLRIATHAADARYQSFFQDTKNFSSASYGQGLPGIACKQRNIVVWNNIHNVPEFKRNKQAKKYKIKSAVAVPILSHDTIIGCMVFFKKDTIKPIDKDSSLNRICQSLGTELKRLKTEAELNTLFNLSPDILCIANKHGYFSKVNPAFSQMTGYSESELKSKPIIDFIHKEDLELTQNELEQNFLKQQRSNYFENRYITKSGDSIWLSWTSVNLIDEQLVYAVAKNVTEKKALEKLLQKTNKMAQIGHWEVDLEKKTVYWSDVMKELYEVPNTYEPSFESSFGFYPEDQQKEIRMMTENVLNGNATSGVLETKIITYKGHERWIKAICEAEYKKNKCVRLYGSSQDIHEKKKAQIELQNAYKEKDNIIASITDGFIALDKQWHVKYWNPAAEKIFDMPKNKILNKNLWETYPQAKDMKFYREYHKVMKGKMVRKFLEYYPPKKIWFEIVVYPSELGLTVHFKDITKRKSQEEEILDIKNLQNHVINSTNDFIWAIDKNYKLILANEAYLKGMKKYVGVSYKIGNRVISASNKKWGIGQKERKLWMNNYERALSGQPVLFTMKIGDKGQLKTHQQIALHPIKRRLAQGKTEITGVACFSRDITERNQYIKEIEEQNERFKEISWLQSHVVRAPVARIMGLLNLLKLYDDKIVIHDVADRILYSAKELDQIIKDISDKTQAVEQS